MSDEEAVEFLTSEQCTQLFTRDNVTNSEEGKKYEKTNYDLEMQEGGSTRYTLTAHRAFCLIFGCI